MADFGGGVNAAIPLGIKTPDTFSTIGNMVDIARGVQAFQTGKSIQQQQSVAAQQAQGALDARMAIGKVMSDPSIRDPNTGLPDLNKVWPALQVADPNGYLRDEVFNKIANVNTDMMKVQGTGLALGNQGQEYVGGRLGALAADPNVTKADVNQALDDMVRVAGTGSPAIQTLVDVTRRNIAGLDQPGTVGPVLKRIRDQAFSVAQQAPQTALVGTGAVTQPMQTNQLYAAPAPVGQPIANAVGPGQQETPGVDAMGNPIIIAKSPQGAVSAKPMPGSSTPPMLSLPPGESQQTRAQLEQERNDAKNALVAAPVMHTTNRGVMEEIDKTTTGTLGPRMATAMSAAGVVLPNGWGGASAEQKASAYDLVGKYLERNALTAAQSMGPHTNAGLESQVRAQGSVAYNPTGIKKITQLNDALVTGAEHYQPGLEKAITTSPSQIFAKRQYDADWANNFDPRAMMMYNAAKNGNSAEVNALLKSWGGKDSALTKQILDKAANLQSLSNTGHLPTPP